MGQGVFGEFDHHENDGSIITHSLDAMRQGVFDEFDHTKTTTLSSLTG